MEPKLVHGSEGPKGVLFLWVREWIILGVIIGKINNMLLCGKKIMLIGVCVMY